MRRWTPTLEINMHTKITNGLLKTGWQEGQTYYTATQGILIHGLRPHALFEITVLQNDTQKATHTTEQRNRDTEI